MSKTVVTPWEVKGNIKYNELVQQFGVTPIDSALLERFTKLTGREPHVWLKRGLFFAHRDFDKILDAYEKKEQIFLYTGRGPTSDSMHIAHLIPFIFTQWLQDVFGAILVIQISDDEKYYFKALSLEETKRLGRENSKDIVACGFDPKKTFIYSDDDFHTSYEKFVMKIKKVVKLGETKQIFGFDNSSNIGMVEWGCYQLAAGFKEAYSAIFDQTKPAHCLVTYAIDQDNYFRLARDVADRLSLQKPCTLISKFMIPLSGSQGGKMSSSDKKDPPIFLDDSPETIAQKIRKAFSGTNGDGSLEDHQLKGGNIESDVSYQYLQYFEFNESRFQEITSKFSSGEMGCAEIKLILTQNIQALVSEHQRKRALVDLTEFYDITKFAPLQGRDQ